MMDSFWLFGYGSLMWNPGFDYEEAQICRLYGYHRSFCIYSTHYRGMKELPGLVLGLKKGGSCQGLAFKIAASNAEETYNYLIEREQVSGVYKEKYLNVYFADRPHARALTFVADSFHEQYASKLALNDMVSIISKATGKAGKNVDYALNTIGHLQKLGIRDRQLEDLAQKLNSIGLQSII